METNHKYRIAYIRLNKQEEVEHTQENLILSKNLKINEFVFEAPDDNKVKLKELLKNIKFGEALVVADMCVIADTNDEFIDIVNELRSKSAYLYIANTGLHNGKPEFEQLMNGLSFCNQVQKFRKNESSYKPKEVQYLCEKVPNKPHKTRVIISDDTVTQTIRMVCDGETTFAAGAKKLGISKGTLRKAMYDKIASGEVVKKSASEIKIEQMRSILPKNWKRLYFGYESGSLKRKEFVKASGLTSGQLATCIKYQKAGYFN